ncbi:GNAT family [Phlyctema vagabunda]|uniref:GNAT family n=1 Tax=Phlyctema vagabunda TaxID=108571 RepID=A0ABR4PC50_9HELO
MTLEILQVPSDEEGARSYVEKYKAFRLHSLQVSPEAFLSTYAREKEFSMDVWLARLVNPSATTFIVTQSDRILSSLTVLSNLSMAPEEVSPLANPWISSNREATSVPRTVLHSRINGLFTLPEARRQGLGQALIERAIAYTATEAESVGKNFVMSIAVETSNIAAKDLYRRCGFVVIAEEIGAQGHNNELRTVCLLKYTPKL